MIRKFKKQSNLSFYSLKGYLEGHIFSYGKVGGGKSVSTLSIIQGYHDIFGYKIWDIFGGERDEHLYWTLPSTDDTYWNNKIGSIGKFDEQGPKQYKVNLLYPYFEGSLPKKLPQKKVDGQIVVDSKVFTIPIKSIIPTDISCVCGTLSENSIYIWNELMEKTTKKTNLGEFLHLASKIKGIGNSTFYKNFILPMRRHKFLSDNYADTNLDIISESKDKEAISVLCLDAVPKDFHLFVINYLCRRINEEADKNNIPKKNILFIREAATFFRATDDAILPEKNKIFRTLISNYMRMSRRGVYFACDCQSAAETKSIVQGSSDYILIFLTQSERDKEELCDGLKRERRMRQDQVADLAFLEKGQAYIAESGRNVVKVQIVLPRTMYWKKEYGNFYKNVWNRFGGEWKQTEEVRDYIDARLKFKAPEEIKEEEEDEEEIESEEEIVVAPTEQVVKEKPKKKEIKRLSPKEVMELIKNRNNKK